MVCSPSFFQRDHDTALGRWPWAMNFWSILQIQSVQFLFRLETGFKRSQNSEEVAENWEDHKQMSLDLPWKRSIELKKIVICILQAVKEEWLVT